MVIASQESQARGEKLPVLEQVLSMFKTLWTDGYGEEGTQALIRAYAAEKKPE